ncbi:chloride channel protein [Eisenbergiella massiliensis]|uniref:chloride channel protein n=1 Tax=Eisenbergiella massiliensis TaxID=1720294 RepID=UPI00399B5A8F
MNWLRAYAEKIYRNLGQYFRWLLFGVVTGVAVGLFASLFSWCLIQVTSFRMGHRYMFLTLPLGGLLIVFTYKAFHFENNGGTDSVIESIHSEITIPFRMALLIFSSTIITILCGGSVGREGAALQIGGSIGKKLGDIFHFNVKDKKIILMSGMAAAFAALFGTPMAAAFFAMEVSSVGIMYYAALVPCICAALIAHKIAFSLGVQTENFHVMNDLELSLIPGLKVVLLAICCAILSILFCMMLQMGEALFKKYFSNLYIRIAAGGLLLILLTLICGSQDYLGTGMPVIEHALSGTAIPWAFFFKMLFTVITISAGYKGGEIVPSLFIGATFGCTLGALLGLPASLGAAVGMIAVFCGVTLPRNLHPHSLRTLRLRRRLLLPHSRSHQLHALRLLQPLPQPDHRLLQVRKQIRQPTHQPPLLSPFSFPPEFFHHLPAHQPPVEETGVPAAGYVLQGSGGAGVFFAGAFYAMEMRP